MTLALAGSLAAPVGHAGGPDEYRTVVTPTRGAASEFDQDRSVHVVDDEALQTDQPADGPAAIAALPGVFLQRTNRGAGAPMLRSFVGPQNLILIDGVRYNQSTFRTGPNQYAALVDPLSLRSIEVVLGPSSALYGSGALGGVINYLTLDAPRQDGLAMRSLLRFASADLATESSVFVGARYGGVASSVGASIRRHDRLRTGGGHRVPLSGYLQGDWRGKVSVDLDDGWTLSGAYLGSRLHDAARVDNLGKGEVRLYDNDDHLTYWRVARGSSGWLREVQLTGSYHRLDERVDRTNCPKNAAGSVEDQAACLTLGDDIATKRRVNLDIVQTIGVQLTADVRLLDDLLRITGGAEAYVDFVQSRRADAKGPDFVWEDKDRGNFSDGSRSTMIDAFIYAEGRPIADTGTFELVLEGGARISHTGAHAPDVPGLGDVDYDHLGPSFGAGARALLFGMSNVYVSWSQGFRSPNLQETTVLGDTGNSFEVPNDGLGPERADSIEVGARLHLPWIRAGAAYFHTILSDAIVREDTTFDGASEVDGKSVVHRVNAAEAIYDGLEVSAELGPFEGVTFEGTLSWVQGDVFASDGSTEPIRREPPLSGRFGVAWHSRWEGLHVGAFVDWAAPQDRLSGGDRKDLRICQDPTEPGRTLGDDCEGTDGWASVSLRAGLAPAEGLRVEVSVHNLLDAKYRYHGSGHDAPGIDTRISVRYDL